MDQRGLDQTDYLLDQIQRGQASDVDYQQLLDLIAAHPEDEYTEYIHQYVQRHASFDPITAASPNDPQWRAMLLTILTIDKPKNDFVAPVHRVHLLKTAWFRSVAAAIFILIIGTVAYLWKTQKQIPAVVTTNPVPMRNDVAPGGNRAVLTLADGRIINLDSAANGQLAIQGSSLITKKADGEIQYSAKTNGNDHPEMTGTNTMSTPRGGQYELRLPDGTHAWLNAESSITYPVAFSGNERKVSVTGEVYFEVTKNKAAPFYVQVNEVNVQVLGTHFNVNAYANEGELKTTLLEGSVKISNGTQYAILSPNQQAIVHTNNEININKQVDMASVMAWKNGQFAFTEADIQQIMRQVERWYDVEVIYQANIDQHFVANIPRNVPVSKLLHLLELTNHVHFNIEGKTITVLP